MEARIGSVLAVGNGDGDENAEGAIALTAWADVGWKGERKEGKRAW